MKKLIGTTKLKDLPVGHFADVNGNIVFRFKLDHKPTYWFPDGIIVVEKHNHLIMQDAYRAFNTGKDPDESGYFCDIIEQPEKKHCDGAIAMLRKMMTDPPTTYGEASPVDGLSYVEAMYRLKVYIREWIERNDKAKV